jgi:hypothetical protein
LLSGDSFKKKSLAQSLCLGQVEPKHLTRVIVAISCCAAGSLMSITVAGEGSINEAQNSNNLTLFLNCHN